MPLILQDAPTGAAADTIQTINSGVSSNIIAWNSTNLCAMTVAALTITIAQPTTGDIGKSVTVTNNGTFAFTINMTGGLITSTAGLTISAGQTVTIKAITTTTAQVIGANASQSVLGEFGSQTFGVSGQQNLTTTVADLNQSTFTLPTAGTWEVTYTAHTFTVSNANLSLYVADSLNSIIAGSIGQSNEASASQSFIPITKTVNILTTGSAVFKLRGISSVAATGGILANDGALRSNTINWKKISGFSPSTGQAVRYISVKRSTTNQTGIIVGSDVIYNALSASGGIPYSTSTGVFSLTANETYHLAAFLKLRNDGTGTTSRYIVFEWVDASNNVALPGLTQGVNILATSLLNESSISYAGGIYTPSAGQTIKVRITGADGSNLELDANRTSAVITQIGSSATTTTTRVNVICRNKTAQTLTTNTWVPLTNWVEVQDPTNSFDPVTGIFTAPRTSTYQFSTGNGTPLVSIGAYIGQAVFKNGVQFYNFLILAAGTASQYPQTNGVVELNAGDTLQARTFQGGVSALDAVSPSNSWFTITEINPTY